MGRPTPRDKPSGSGRHTLSPEEFRLFQTFLYEHSGIALGDTKRYLVQSRLGNLLPETGLDSLGELVRRLVRGTLPIGFRTRLIDAMTTNETFWFRDGQQFELLKNRLLPELNRRVRGPLRIWSAACSTGQEPYSISICIREAIREGKMPQADVHIIGTDLSSGALKAASRAIYSDLTMARGLPADLKQRYFVPHADGWQLKPEVTRQVRFQQFNLLHPFTLLGQFDLIFCRHVLIYFSPERRHDILQRMGEALTPDGCLFLGGTETLPPGASALTQVYTDGVRCYTRTAR